MRQGTAGLVTRRFPDNNCHTQFIDVLNASTLTLCELMARVLVTGASGFIGLQLVEALLARGDDVRCLVRSTSQVEPLAKLGVQLAHGDVTDRETLPAADCRCRRCLSPCRFDRGQSFGRLLPGERVRRSKYRPGVRRPNNATDHHSCFVVGSGRTGCRARSAARGDRSAAARIALRTKQTSRGIGRGSTSRRCSHYHRATADRAGARRPNRRGHVSKCTPLQVVCRDRAWSPFVGGVCRRSGGRSHRRCRAGRAFVGRRFEFRPWILFCRRRRASGV